MDFMLALNVTIYGLGIVFLALLVLMVAIMLLTKVFAVVTGRELLSAVPAPSPTLVVVPAGMAVTAPAYSMRTSRSSRAYSWAWNEPRHSARAM